MCRLIKKCNVSVLLINYEMGFNKQEQHENERIKNVFMEMSGFEPEASYMRSKRSTTELHPHAVHDRLTTCGHAVSPS